MTSLALEDEEACNAMNEQTINPVAFHLIGRSAARGLEDISGLDCHPALYAPFRDLNNLRHDFPIVLGNYNGAEDFVRSLSDIVNDVLKENAPPGADGEYMRCQVLNLEQEIRILATGSGISLSKAWGAAVRRLRSRADSDSIEALDECLELVQAAFWFDGQVVDYNATMPIALMRQAWAIDQRAKSQVSRKRIDELILRLENILGAEIKKTEAALSPDKLKGSVGASFENAFDFDVMSRILTPARPRVQLPEDRRQRIRAILLALKSQRFFRSAKWSDRKGHRVAPHSFLYHNATSALRVIRDRVPEMVELTKAISMAELEIANRYEPPKHDAFFSAFDETSLSPEDVAFFPTYLIALDEKQYDAAEKARILELLSSDIHAKVLAQTDDILDGLVGTKGQLSFGGMSWQLASMAVGLNEVFVLQTSAANLYKLRDKVWDGLSYPGPALFSVFSGTDENNCGLPPYLVSAAATESRAFPTFTYDPSKGPDWASRLSISGNPQLETDWPIHNFPYEDEDLQRQSEDIAFTYVEFAVSDKRFSRYLARVPRGEWTDKMMPAGQFLATNAGNGSEPIPYVLMVDQENMVHRFVVDNRLILAARRCLGYWHNLQEMGGVHNSHALNLLKSERELWQIEKDLELANLRSQPESKPEPSETDAGGKPAVIEPEHSDEDKEVQETASSDPFIETPRCTTCNECTDINSQMFAYNDNKQAYISDPAAGTYRQLVEAAETCQVSIIHPGKPKDMSEPNLEELMDRARLFD